MLTNKSSVPVTCAAVVLTAGLAGCAVDKDAPPDGRSDVTGLPSSSSSECGPEAGGGQVEAQLPDGTSVALVSTGIPTREPAGGRIQQTDEGEWDPPMRSDGFLLVGLPEEAGADVPDDLVETVNIATFDVDESTDARLNCNDSLNADVSYVESDYLPMWEVTFDEPLGQHALAEVTAPGSSGVPLNFQTDELISVPYPDDGELESQPQFVAERIYAAYFAEE